MAWTRRRTIKGGLGTLGLACLPVSACEATPTPGARPDLYDCEGCEATGEVAREKLSSTTTIAGPDEPGERLVLSGKVMSHQTRQPVAGVVIYLHHTNADGLYAGGRRTGRASDRHGRLRGWAVSDENGDYAFHTIKPAPYPGNTLPAHIHLYILEPGKPPYWIDDVVFDGEFGVTPAYRRQMDNRGGNGIISLGRDADGTWLARRDIILERHPT